MVATPNCSPLMNPNKINPACAMDEKAKTVSCFFASKQIGFQ